MNLTEEQRQIIEETITNKNGVYSVEACAGSGKSFTIFKAIDYIKKNEPNAKILYLVFNKANQVEVEAKLMKYATWLNPVIVKTAHSYAYNKWLKTIGAFNALEQLDWSIIQEVKLKYYKPDIKYSKKKPFIWLHDKYCASKLLLDSFCENLELHWEDNYDGPDKPMDITIKDSRGRDKAKFGIQIDNCSYVSKQHIEVFKKIIEAHKFKKFYTHGMYLKEVAYSTKSGGDSFDYVFFDEAQDANYFMLKLLDKQNVKKKYFIGDERQSIYKFGCNENVFETLKFDKKYKLTKSFRFDKEVAKLATDVLQMNSDHIVHGTEQDYSINDKKITRLYRTNAKLFQDALEFAFEYRSKCVPLKINLMKSVEDDFAMQEILSFLKLYYKCIDPSYYYQNTTVFPEFICNSLKNFETAIDNGEYFLNVYNEQYDFLSDNIHTIFNYVQKHSNFVIKYLYYKQCLVETDPSAKEITFVTMHKSKGMEWDNVVIAEPTRLYYVNKNNTIKRNSNYLQELNLAYVAITRARKTLNAEILRDELCNESSNFEYRPLTIINGVTKELTNV